MSKLTRRRLIEGMAAVLGSGAGAGVAFEFGLFRRRWPATPYDDLLDQLPLRAQALTLGKSVLAAEPGFRPAPAAARLRLANSGRSLGEVAAQDAAEGRTVEVSGWVLPLAVAELCALAAL